MKAIGDRALWLDRGRVVESGRPGPRGRQVPGRHGGEGFQLPASAARRAGAAAGGRACARPRLSRRIPNIDHRYGDGRAEVLGIAVLDEQGRPLHLLEPGSRIVVRISVRAKEELPLPIVGFMLRNQLGMDFSGTNTAREGYAAAAHAAGRYRARWISTSTCRSSTRRRFRFRRPSPMAR